LRLSYDPNVDAVYIYLVDDISGPVSTRSVDPSDIDGMINLDFDVNEQLVGIELVPASKLLPPSLLEGAS
jgi:uncharacterized protein YuzE